MQAGMACNQARDASAVIFRNAGACARLDGVVGRRNRPHQLAMGRFHTSIDNGELHARPCWHSALRLRPGSRLSAWGRLASGRRPLHRRVNIVRLRSYHPPIRQEPRQNLSQRLVPFQGEAPKADACQPDGANILHLGFIVACERLLEAVRRAGGYPDEKLARPVPLAVEQRGGELGCVLSRRARVAGRGRRTVPAASSKDRICGTGSHAGNARVRQRTRRSCAVSGGRTAIRARPIATGIARGIIRTGSTRVTGAIAARIARGSIRAGSIWITRIAAARVARSGAGGGSRSFSAAPAVPAVAAASR